MTTRLALWCLASILAGIIAGKWSALFGIAYQLSHVFMWVRGDGSPNAIRIIKGNQHE